MPGIADQLIAPEPSGMLGDHHAVGHHADLSGRAADRDGPASKCCRDAVTVAVQHHEAGARDPQHVLHISIKGCGDLPQSKLLFNEASRDGPVRCRRVLALSQLPAPHGQPLVQRLEIGKPGQRREQPFPDVADLVLNLTFLPARRRSAGDRLEDIMVRQHQETAVEQPLPCR